MSSNIFLTKWSDISGQRFDPNSYHSERINAINKLKSSKISLQKLKFIASNDKNIVTENIEELPYIGLENIESNTGVYFATKDKESFSSAIKFKKGQVLFPKLRPYLNKVYYAQFDGLCSTEFHVFDSNIIDNQYLAIFLRSNLVVSQTRHLMSGNTLPRLQTEDIENLLIPIPSKNIQTEIILTIKKAYKQKKQKEDEAKKLLDSIDEYLLKELGINLPNIDETDISKRSFLRKWSEISGNRFDPIFHKSTFKALIENIHNKVHAQLKDIVIFSSETWNQNSYFKNTFPYIEISEIDISFGIINNINYVDVNKAPTRAKMIVRDNDIIISTTRPNRGAISLVKTDDIMIASTGFCVIRNIHHKIQREYLFEILKSSIVLNQFDQRSSGGNYPAITQEDIGKVFIPLPSIHIQNEIANHIKNMKEQAKVLKQQAIDDFEKAKKEVEAILLGDRNDI